MLTGYFDKWRIFDSITSGVIVQNASGVIVYVNETAKRMLGFSLEQFQQIIEDQSEYTVIHEDGSPYSFQGMFSHAITQSFSPIRNIVTGLTIPGQNVKWLLFNSQPNIDPKTGQVTEIISTFIDISERKTAEEGLRRMNRALKVLSESNQALVRAADEIELLNEICRILIIEGGYSLAWVGFPEDDTDKEVRCVAKYGYDQGYISSLKISWADEPKGYGPVGTAIRTGLNTVSHSIKNDSHFLSRDEAAKRGFISAIALPLLDGERTLGALVIYAKEKDAFDAEEVELLQELSNDLVYGILSLRAREERKKAREALKFSQFALDQSSDGVFWIDNKARFLYVNEAACSSLEYTKEELLALSVTDIDPGFSAEQWPAHWEDLKQNASTSFETLHRTKAGRIFPVEVLGDLHEYNGQEVHCVFARDITERRKIEESLREKEEKFRSLVEHTSDWFWELDSEHRLSYSSPRIFDFIGFTNQEVLGKTPFELMPPEEAERLKEPLTRMLQSQQEFALFENTLLHKDGSLVIIETNGNPVFDPQGVFQGFRGTNRDVTSRRKTEQDLKVSLTRLRRSIEETIQAMARLLEIRDPYTAGHQRRVAQLVRVIAEELGLPEDQSEGVHLAAVIHDIGKIYTPAEILSKPGKITEIEFSMIQTHPQVGYDILKQVEFPWPIADIVLQHHERLNGSGYPNRLVGSEIMFDAQIICVADVVEAMSSHRPYRPALGIEKALQEITENRGILYEPQVVDVCLRIFREKGFSFDPQ